MDSTAPQGGSAKDTYLPPASVHSKRWLWISVFAILAVAVGYYSLARVHRANNTAALAKAAAHPPMPVAATAARRGDLNRYLSAIGTVTAFNTVTVRTRVDGQIVNVAFKEGQTVHQGDLLVEIDPRPYRAALAQAEGQTAKDQATLLNAKLLMERDRTLYQQGVIAAQDFDNQQSLVGQSVGAVQSDRANVAAAKVQVDYTRIVAPITGRIGLRLVDQGNIVHAADTTGLAIITQLQPIAVDFSIPEDNLQQVIKDMRSGQTLAVEALDRELKTQLAAGTLETFDSQIDPTTGTIKLKAVFPNNDYALFPNEFVNVRLLVDTLRDTVLAPAAAVQRNPQGTFVYVVTPDNTVEMRAVTVGATQGDTVALASGVTPGEMLVTDGLDRLQVGSKVVIQTPAKGIVLRSSQ
ncbi:MAG TPA: MdtA/MuxA family multidrug efflux RND transporter periplasmic adaptor subunit [Candidatus Binataceae bacterium]|nr:MdtA/MuxA family multidrug efflux RND transporter periplasmic adaptor subunit [Candidatus Binataceae bacterium]